jgi:putative ABC transport system permease protein
MIWSLASKNIWRNKTRSMVVVASMVIGMVGGIMAASIYMGISEQRVRKAIENETPHLRVINPKFRINQDINLVVANPNDLIKQIKTLPEVSSVASRINISGMAGTAKTNVGVNIYGINPVEEKEVLGFYRTIQPSEGDFFVTPKRNPIILSKTLAEKLNAKLNSKIILTFQATNGTLVGDAFKVVGIYETKNPSFDTKNIFVLKENLAKSALFDLNNSHEINIKLKNKADVATVETKLQKMFGNLDVLTWKELQPDLAYLSEMMEGILPLVMFIILSALSFGIVNTMLMAVLERRKELGMLMAIGMNKFRVFRMIVVETILLTLLGGVVGIFISIILISIFSRTGIDISFIGDGYSSLGVDSKIYPKIGVEYYVTIIILILLSGLFSSIYPALKALKLKPVEAIRVDS